LSVVIVSSITTRSFSFPHTPPTEIYTLSLHDALPISSDYRGAVLVVPRQPSNQRQRWGEPIEQSPDYFGETPHKNMLSQLTRQRSEEHTSELQSRSDLVCRLLLEKKKKKQ